MRKVIDGVVYCLYYIYGFFSGVVYAVKETWRRRDEALRLGPKEFINVLLEETRH